MAVTTSRHKRLAGMCPGQRMMHGTDYPSRETELSRQHPLHVVTAWIGNSAPIAARHYLQVTDGDYDAALVRDANSDAQPTQNPTQQPTGDSGRLSQETPQAPGNQGLVLETAGVSNDVQKCPVPPRGVEPLFSD